MEEYNCSSSDAVAARNGLWVTLRCRPYCAAAVKPEYIQPGCQPCSSSAYFPPLFFLLMTEVDLHLVSNVCRNVM